MCSCRQDNTLAPIIQSHILILPEKGEQHV